MLTHSKKTGLWRCFTTSLMAVAAITQAPAATAEPAEKIYQDACAFCHSRPLPPFPGPELRGRNLAPDYIKTLVRHGSKGMLTFTPADISDAELTELSQWLKASPAPVRGGPQ